jgi:hypothetical protein
VDPDRVPLPRPARIATSFPPIATDRPLNMTAPPAGELGGAIGIVAGAGYCAATSGGVVRSPAIVASARALRSAPVW